MENQEEPRDLAESTEPVPAPSVGEPPHENEVQFEGEGGEGEKYDGGDIPPAPSTEPDLDPQPEPTFDPNQPSESETPS
jgi:hypothetical protein